jgi:hypothetical protein
MSGGGPVTVRPQTCPECGGHEPFHPDTPKDAKLCTPLSCSAWTVTARLTKQGQKPLKPDGRADLRAAR